MHTPKWIIDQYREMIMKFIWKNKPAKIKYNCLINEKQEGGLKLQDLELKIQAISMKWMKQLHTAEEQPWTLTMESVFKTPCNIIPQLNMNTKDTPSFTDDFYNDMTKNWAKYHYKDVNEPLYKSQLVWLNSNIRIDKKPVFYKHIYNEGIMYIDDFIDNTNFKTKIDLENEYSCSFKMLEYESLTNSIKKSITTKEMKVQIENNYEINWELKIGLKNINYAKLTTKKAYNLLISKQVERATAFSKWQEKYHINDAIWKNANIEYYRLMENIRICNVQFKLLHRIINCNQKLKLWKIKDNDKCNFCDQTDTIEHYFVECHRAKNIWTEVTEWIMEATQTKFPVNDQEKLLGIYNSEELPAINCINWCFLILKHHIYVQNNAGKDLCFKKYIETCKMQLEVKRLSNVSNLEKFEEQWFPLIKAVQDINVQ